MTNEQAKPVPPKQNDHKFSILLFLLLVLAGAISFFGASVTKQEQGITLSEYFGQDKETTESSEKVFARGSVLQEQSCSGCHALEKRLLGPSFAEIADSYRKVRAGRAESAAGSQALIASAISHASNNWSNYPRGPALRLAPADRMALAYWILNAESKESSSQPSAEHSAGAGDAGK